MIKYQTIDGFTFEAATAQQCIVILRSESHNPDNSLERFADSLVRRAKIQTGKTIPSYPYDDLVAGLIAAKLLIKISD
jgi:hypothetical protein